VQTSQTPFQNRLLMLNLIPTCPSLSLVWQWATHEHCSLQFRVYQVMLRTLHVQRTPGRRSQSLCVGAWVLMSLVAVAVAVAVAVG
jgi:hypothetical protein